MLKSLLTVLEMGFLLQLQEPNIVLDAKEKLNLERNTLRMNRTDG